MTKTKPIYIKIFQILIILCICMLPACRSRSQPAEERDFSTMDLLIRASEMPDGWYENLEPADITDITDAATEASRIVFLADTDSQRNNAGFEVIRYGNEEEADWLFMRLYSTYGNTPEKWVEPVTSANQAFFGCENRPEPDSATCHWNAQYEEYIVSFNTWLIPNFMSYNDIKQVIKAIDARMVRYLKAE